MFGHAGEAHPEEAVGLWSQLLHQPTWIGLLIVAALTTGIYFLGKALGFKLPTRLLTGVTGLIVAGVVYLPHNAAVTGIVLSVGFIATFVVVFTMLGPKPD